MGELVNLRLKRKEKKRGEAAEKASENRLQFGRTKQEKVLTAAQVALNDMALDGHKRDV